MIYDFDNLYCGALQMRNGILLMKLNDGTPECYKFEHQFKNNLNRLDNDFLRYRIFRNIEFHLRLGK